jgi:hypothetical protein
MGFDWPHEIMDGFDERGIIVGSAQYQPFDGLWQVLVVPSRTAGGPIQFFAEDSTEAESILRQHGATNIQSEPIRKR